MAEIFFRTDLDCFEPVLGVLYLVVKMPEKVPLLFLSHYARVGKYVRRVDLAVMEDFVALEYWLDGPGTYFQQKNVERDMSIVAIQKASANAILAFVRLWKDGPDDFLRYAEEWKKTTMLKPQEIKRVGTIVAEEVRRQQLYGQRR